VEHNRYLTISWNGLCTGCLVMNATKVFAYYIGQKWVPRTKTGGKSLLYIGHFDIQRPFSTYIIFEICFPSDSNSFNNWSYWNNAHIIFINLVLKIILALICIPFIFGTRRFIYMKEFYYTFCFYNHPKSKNAWKIDFFLDTLKLAKLLGSRANNG
jgi:hypothetical protein